MANKSCIFMQKSTFSKLGVLLFILLIVLSGEGENFDHTGVEDADGFLTPHRECSFDKQNGSLNFLYSQNNSKVRFDEQISSAVGIGAHKHLTPVLLSEVIGYFIIASIIIMVGFNDLLTEGFIVGVLLLGFEYNSLQSIGYMSLIATIIFTFVFGTKANAKRNYKDLLAVDYMLITILLPFQIFGRIVGTVLNFETNYIINFFAIYVGLIFALYKFLFKLMSISHEESKTDGIYSGKYISLSILKSSNALRDMSDKSSSNSSFSVDSDIRLNNPAVPYQIREESNEESSNRNDNFVHPSEASDQYNSSKSYSMRKRGDINKDSAKGINDLYYIKDNEK